MKRKLAEIVGWYGAVAIVLAYALVSFKVVSPSGYAFQVLNLTGAIGIIIISSIKRVKQSVALNTFWAIIALIALIRIVLGH